MYTFLTKENYFLNSSSLSYLFPTLVSRYPEAIPHESLTGIGYLPCQIHRENKKQECKVYLLQCGEEALVDAPALFYLQALCNHQKDRHIEIGQYVTTITCRESLFAASCIFDQDFLSWHSFVNYRNQDFLICIQSLQKVITMKYSADAVLLAKIFEKANRSDLPEHEILTTRILRWDSGLKKLVYF